MKLGPTLRRRTRPPRASVPYLALAATLLITAVAAYYVAASEQARDRLRFENAARRTHSEINDRLNTYVALLRAGTGLFAASQEVSREEFHAFVERIELRRQYPGIQGIGFSAYIPKSERDAFVAEMRRAGMENFDIRPDGARDEYHSIIYLEPLDQRNRAAIGFDMFSEPVRRAAMERARDTGTPAASGRVTLVQEIEEKKQAGFLIYVPVYRTGTPPPLVEERRADLRGFVYSPFRVGDLLEGIFGNERHPLVNFRLYDGPEVEANLLYSTHLWSGEAEAYEKSPRFMEKTTFDVAGQSWTLVFLPRPDSDIASRGWIAPFVLLGGVLCGLTLFVVTRAQVRARAAAEHAADERRRSEEALRASEIRFRTVIEQSPLSIQIFSPDGRTQRVNHAWEKLWSITLEQLGDYNILQDQQLVAKGIMPYIERGFAGEAVAIPAILYDPEATLPGLAQEHPKRWVRAFIYPVKDEAGCVREVVLVHEDITERVRLDEQLRERAEQLAEANRLKDEFLATVSHELRTPLTSVLGWANMLRTETFDAEATARALESIERNARAQTRLIEDLLEVSRVITGKLRLNVRPIELGPIIEAAVESVEPAAAARDVRLELELDHRSGWVTGDPDRLQQVVWNLLSNAIKFTPRGGQVRVRLARADACVEVTVADTGRGISADFLPYVFERFRQFDGRITREHGGLGLGLSIAQHLVELHGGTIRAESQGEGHGATFIIRLPLLESRAAEDEVQIEEKWGEKSVVPHPSSTILHELRVLIADDDADSRALIAAILSRQGAAVTAVASAHEAYEAITRLRPDVFVTDIGMPGEDGYELIRRVRALGADRGGATPAAALTAYARPEDRERALIAGFGAHISKPVEPAELIAEVARLAGRRQQVHDAHRPPLS